MLLRSGLDAFTDLEREGLIQRFEFTYELAWKTLKDYLEDSGVIGRTFAAKASLMTLREVTGFTLLEHVRRVGRRIYSRGG